MNGERFSEKILTSCENRVKLKVAISVRLDENFQPKIPPVSRARPLALFSADEKG